MKKTKVLKINTYRVPMSRKEGAYAYIKATSKKEAQIKFDNGEISNVEYDSSFQPDGMHDFEQDGTIELYDEGD